MVIKVKSVRLFWTATLEGGVKREGLDSIMNYLNIGIMVHAFRLFFSKKPFIVLHY